MAGMTNTRPRGRGGSGATTRGDTTTGARMDRLPPPPTGRTTMPPWVTTRVTQLLLTLMEATWRVVLVAANTPDHDNNANNDDANVRPTSKYIPK
jgi:hypothetical protein